MQRFKAKLSASGKKLTKVLLILLCFFVPSQIFYWTLCINEDRNVPENAEVIVSSCMRPIVRGVPGGELLFVHENLTGRIYLLDLRTGEKRKVPNEPILHDKDRVVFLSPELAWFERRGSSSDYIFDLADGQQYELLDLLSLPLLEGNKFNPANYSYIQSADRVFIDLSKNRLIALSSDFRTNQNGRVILSGYTISTDDKEILLKLVKSLGMEYEDVDLANRHSNMSSPTGAFVYRDLVFEGVRYSYSFRGWYYDDSGVIIHDDYGTYWLQPRYLGDYGLNIYHLSLPVLKLRLVAP